MSKSTNGLKRVHPDACACLVLTRIYGKAAVSAHNYSKTLSSVTFAGTVVGMLVFGYLSDKMGRKFGMVSASFGVFFNFVFGALVFSLTFLFLSRDLHSCLEPSKKLCFPALERILDHLVNTGRERARCGRIRGGLSWFISSEFLVRF